MGKSITGITPCRYRDPQSRSRVVCQGACPSEHGLGVSDAGQRRHCRQDRWTWCVSISIRTPTVNA